MENIFEGIQEPRWPRASNSLCTPPPKSGKTGPSMQPPAGLGRLYLYICMTFLYVWMFVYMFVCIWACIEHVLQLTGNECSCSLQDYKQWRVSSVSVTSHRSFL